MNLPGRLLIFLICLLLGKPLAAQPPEGKGYELLFEDNFDGERLNEDHWAYRLGRRTGGGYIDGLNLKENVYVRDGALHIAAKQEMIDGKPENTGGGVISKYNFGYGYYESLSKPFMKGRGVHTSFWQAGSLSPNNSIFEIDSYEIDSKSWMACNNLYIHIRAAERSVPWPHRGQVPISFDLDGWFLDGYEFTPDGVIFYDNGKEVARAEWKELTAAQSVWLTALNGCGKVDAEEQPGESVFEYFRYYAKDYPGINLLPNGNFEYNQDYADPFKPVCWTTGGTQQAVKVTGGEAFRDVYKLRIGLNEPFNASLSQKLEFIRNGEYVLTARVKGSCRGGKAMIDVITSGDTKKSVILPSSTKWKKIQLSGIRVTSNQASIEIHASGKQGDWFEIDDMNFMKPPLPGQKPAKKEPFTLLHDPVWQLAKSEPIRFTGDEKFYFFDRSVGLGDAISICFTVNADEMANMTPIARIPQKGNSGWAVDLKQDGGVVFRIGSVENHEDVIASGAYQAGKPGRILCVFDRGTASVYADGKLLQRKSRITQQTMDKEAPGRLGTVGRAYEAISDVIRETGEKDDETHLRKNFRGTLGNIEIYNRAVR